MAHAQHPPHRFQLHFGPLYATRLSDKTSVQYFVWHFCSWADRAGVGSADGTFEVTRDGDVVGTDIDGLVVGNDDGDTDGALEG